MSIPGITGASDSGDSGPSIPAFTSAVSWIDNAFPRNQARFRLDGGYGMNRPDRAEYFGAPAPFAETRLTAYQLSMYVEYAFDPFFSIFFDTPVRWVNPQVNSNQEGYSNANLGFRLMVFAGDSVQTTFQMRAYLPAARDSYLGRNQASLEPALLAHWGITPFLNLEAQAKFWAPLGGADYAGNVFEYGIGLSYGQRSSQNIGLLPVVELVGWSVLGGKTTAPDGFGGSVVQNAAGTNILNLNGGIRWTLGEQADLYTGYSRCLTGDCWFRDGFRLELRVFF